MSVTPWNVAPSRVLGAVIRFSAGNLMIIIETKFSIGFEAIVCM